MRRIQLLVIFAFLYCISLELAAQAPFNRGVNLTGWFQTNSVRQIQFTKFTRQDFENIKSLGCDVIRLPINLHFMTGGEPDYILDPLFLNFLDSAVTWAQETNLHLILDNHTFDPDINTDPSVEIPLVKIWSQLAEHYKDGYENIYYEVLNEPHGIADAIWGTIQQHVIDTIREHDSGHTIIVGPASWNSYNNLDNLPEYSDDNLIYTFHFYDPFLFTHQGASWTNMEAVENIPFPYDAGRMPDVPPEVAGTWIESAYNTYDVDGTVQRVKELIDIAVAFHNSRNVPVYCGEFGVYIPNSPHQDRINWYDTVRTYLEENQIAWTIWDYTGGFGIFEEGGNDLFEYDLDTAIVAALGLIIPQQSDFVTVPDSTGFPVYTDYIGYGIFESSNPNSGLLDYYTTNHPNNDNYCLEWIGEEQYSYIGFDFKPNRDFSYLAEQDFAVDFIIRGLISGASMDIRFIDTKTNDPEDHPWRMRYTIDENLVPWDGKWHHVYLPLSEFIEHGSWDDGWYNPEGLFDWTAIDRFEIVAEHGNLEGNYFWFDNIFVNDQDTATVWDTTTIQMPVNGLPYIHKDNLSLVVYPNPTWNKISIQFNLAEESEIFLSIYGVTGKLIKKWESSPRSAGQNFVNWNCTDDNGNRVRPGVYIMHIATSGGTSINKKIIILE